MGEQINSKALQPITAQFVLLHLSTDENTAEWSKFERMFKAEAKGIPIVYVVRADKEKLFAGNLPGGSLQDFLLENLKKSGRPLSDKQIAMVEEALTSASKAMEEGKIALAGSTIGKFLGVESYAKVMVDAANLGKRIIDEGMKSLDESEKKLASTDEAVYGAVGLLEAVRVYNNKTFPTVYKAANEKLLKAKKNKELAEVFKQADLIDRASVTAIKQPKDAITKLQVVATKYPDSPAARMAEERIKELSGEKIAKADTSDKAVKPASNETPADEPAEEKKPVATKPVAVKKPTGDDVAAADKPTKEEPAAKPANPQADIKKAAGLVKTAQAFLKNGNEAKAREYLQKAIDLAPDSLVAEEAKQLLDTLK